MDFILFNLATISAKRSSIPFESLRSLIWAIVTESAHPTRRECSFSQDRLHLYNSARGLN